MKIARFGKRTLMDIEDQMEWRHKLFAVQVQLGYINKRKAFCQEVLNLTDTKYLHRVYKNSALVSNTVRRFILDELDLRQIGRGGHCHILRFMLGKSTMEMEALSGVDHRDIVNLEKDNRFVFTYNEKNMQRYEAVLWEVYDRLRSVELI